MKYSIILCLLVFSALSFGEVARKPAAAMPAGGPAATADGSYAGMPDGPGVLDNLQANHNAGQNRVCLKIRAFIFETNDDQVPRFVRETTCPPVTWSAIKVKRDAQPKFVPAAGAGPF